MKNISLKLIFRSWWRNKTFTVISILSLAVGIACTNLLAAFVIHEYNVEAGNPNRERIYCIVQDSPMQSGDKVFYAVGDIPPMLKDNYPEVEDYLRISAADVGQIKVDETLYSPIILLQVDSSFSTFFPHQTIAGNLEEALTEPNKIALTEKTATRFFGKENPIGKTIVTKRNNEDPRFSSETIREETSYQVVAVIKENDQSFLSFDGITFQPQRYGGISFFLTNQAIDPEAFALRLKEDGVPTILGADGRYYFYTLQQNYFYEYKAQTIPYFNRQNKSTLSIGLLSALLILLIACFNYINLNFSRLLQQVKMIHIQRLMGASRVDINKQLFFDIFLTVIIGFLFSLLIMYDLIPVFNSIFSGKMSVSFIFSKQVMPLLIGLILILSIIPAVYVSCKINSLSRQQYHEVLSGQGKQRIISVLSVVQFSISIALIIATLTVNRQTKLIQQGGEAYRGLIEISPSGDNSNVRPFVAELRSHPELGEISITEGSHLQSGIWQIVIPDSAGNNMYFSLLECRGNTSYLSTFQINLLQGMQPEEAIKHYARPVYINQRFADLLVGKDNNPIGQSLKSVHQHFDYLEKEDGSKENPITTIAGIVENFFTNSFEEEIFPAIIYIRDELIDNFVCVYFRLDSKHPDRLSIVKQIWEKHNPGKLFKYSNVYEHFIARNQRSFGLAKLLLMYSLISIFLTCFGLFGMALYSTEQRTKEIGIRKVNGATIWQIVKLLNRRFILWITIAFLIAAPVTWILLTRWLQSFVYRADITIWVFIIALVTVTAIALLTVSWHSYKAATGNPVDALRDE